MKHFFYIVVLLFAQQSIGQSFQKTKQMKAYNGFFNFYYEASEDKIYLEVNQLNKEFV